MEKTMKQVKIGTFIAKCRKEQKLTQAQLAEKLRITDRAVSKWETGKSMPDSSIMLELCAILNITVNELLSGEKLEAHHPVQYEKRAEENLIVLKRKEEKNILYNRLAAIIFSVTLSLGITVCLICDIATAHGLTWSLISAISMVFAWVVTVPGMLLGKKGLTVSLVSLSIFVIPYLYGLSCLLHVPAIFTIGSIMAVIAVLFLWLVLAIFNHMGKTRKPTALGISLLAAIPVMFIINLTLSQMINEPLLDVWDILTVLLLLLSATACFMTGRRAKKGKSCG